MKKDNEDLFIVIPAEKKWKLPLQYNILYKGSFR
jgi:hypothetical protein